MATIDDARRITRSFPETTEDPEGFGFSVRDKGFAWAWTERVEPKKPRVRRDDVLAVRVSGDAEKQILLASDPVKFFTEPHYNGFPAILVNLPAIDDEELAELLLNAWRCRAPKRLVQEMDGSAG
ncbi:MAG TPA: MmcQ/YjbR family DNA-binding protein [Thermomicrobiales bacterium]|nr:MmcQ/YjbR family DNA-binding protein [Thermomicrobiales bacterium]